MRRRRRALRLAAVLLGLGLLVALVVRWPGGLPDLSRFDADIEAAARQHGVEADLVRGVVAAESSGDPSATSPAGALGLMQLMPATAREEAQRQGLPAPGPRDLLLDTRLNLRLGTGYLGRLLKRYDGEVAYALAAYNAGATNVGRWRQRAPGLAPAEVVQREGFAETRAYVQRVQAFRERYRAQREERTAR